MGPPTLALLAGLVAAPAGSAAQQGVGATYGARDPHTCPDRTAPTRGTPSAAQAAQYVTCALEGETGSGSLYLLGALRVQVGAGRPYQHVADSFGDIDPRQPVYPIRGSDVAYICAPVHTPPQVAAGWGDNRGTNCSAYPHAQLTGLCYRTTFADWRCTFGGGVEAAPATEHVAPPP